MESKFIPPSLVVVLRVTKGTHLMPKLRFFPSFLLQQLFLVPVTIISPPSSAVYIYALLTDWKLILGFIFLKPYKPLFPNLIQLLLLLNSTSSHSCMGCSAVDLSSLWCSSPLLRSHRCQINRHHLCQSCASSFRLVVCSWFIVCLWFVSYFWSLWCSTTSRLSSDLPDFEPFGFGLSDLWALWPSWFSLDHFPTSRDLIPI